MAQDYERLRPHYPDVLTYAGPASRRALEAGAGTGKATRAFTASGLHVTAVELP